MTEKEIIRVARERIGNKVEVSVGEQGVPDQAISAEMRERVQEVCRYYGTNNAKKEITFNTAQGPTVATPGATTLAASESGGVLSAGSYQYRVSATLGRGETQAGPEATVAATIAGTTGSVAVSWSPVTYADGYGVYGRQQGQEQLLVRVKGATTWTDTGVVMPTSGLPVENSTGGKAGYIQDYDVSAYIAQDVEDIIEVLRQAAYRSDHYMEPMLVDPSLGVPVARQAFIDQGFQQSALEHIQSQERFLRQDEFEWEVYWANDGKQYLRLMPPPVRSEVVLVKYLSTGADIADLPDDARVPLEHAATAALLNCMLNRINSSPSATRDSALDKRYWVEMAERQRDYYDGRYQAAIAKRLRK